MGLNINAGELNTSVKFYKIERNTDKDGFPVESKQNVFKKDAPIMCKWVNAYGRGVYITMQLKLRDPATLTARYSPKLEDKTLMVFRDGDPDPYEIISIDNVEQRNEWLVMKIQRMESAR